MHTKYKKQKYTKQETPPIVIPESFQSSSSLLIQSISSTFQFLKFVKFSSYTETDKEDSDLEEKAIILDSPPEFTSSISPLPELQILQPENNMAQL